MNIVGVFSALLLYYGLFINFGDCTDWIEDFTRCIVDDSEFKQVKFMTSLSDDENLKDPLIEKLFLKLMEYLPILRINFGKNFEFPVESVPDETAETKYVVGAPATLFLLVIETRDKLPSLITKKFIDVAAKMATYHYNPKYLILSISRKLSHDVEDLLQYAWTKKILDLTVIELTQPETIQTSLITIKSQIALPVTQVCFVHRLNPFTNNYTRENWDSNSNMIFPKKVTNLWGYPLRVLTENNPTPVKKSESPFKTVFSILTKKLNCSVEEFYPSHPYNSSDVWRSLYIAMELGNADVMNRPRTYTFGSLNDTQRTAPIRTDKFCALVPILPELKISVSTHLFEPYFLSFSIVLIVWCFMRLLRFNSYPWRMFNIGRVLFGVSVAKQPRRTVERIIFTSLLALFAIFSTTIYASITDITLHKTGQKKFDSFDDIVNSGFPAYIHPLDFQRSSDLFIGPLKGLENIQDSAVGDCPTKLSGSKNIICFIHEMFAKWSIIQDGYDQHLSMKIAHPCFWSESWAFVIGKGSPYRSRLDELILNLHSAGIIAKIADIDPAIFVKMMHGWQEKPNNMNVLRLQLIALSIVGYSLSIFVFIAEIVIHRVSMHRKSKIRPLTPPLFPIRSKIRRKKKNLNWSKLRNHFILEK